MITELTIGNKVELWLTFTAVVGVVGVSADLCATIASQRYVRRSVTQLSRV